MTRGMEGQFKKLFSIVGALLLGALIIFLAWAGGSLVGLPKVSQDEQEKSSLSVVPEVGNSIRTLGFWNNEGRPRDLSTSTTDILARDLIINYSLFPRRPGATTLSSAEIELQAQALAEKVKLPPAKQYALSELNISNDNTTDSIFEYVMGVRSLVSVFFTSKKAGDLSIVFSSSPTISAEAKRKQLSQNIELYKILERGLLAIKVPSNISQSHLSLVQGLSNMKESLVTLSDTYEDPIKGVEALGLYEKGAMTFVFSLKDISDLVQPKE